MALFLWLALISDSFLHLKFTCMSCQVIPKAWPSRVVRGSIKLRIPASLLGSMSSFVPTPDVCFFSDFAEIILQECFQVRRPCVWIHGIPFEAKTEASFFCSFYHPCRRLRLCVQSGLWHWVGVPLWRSGLPEAGALWNDFRIRVSTEGGIPQIWGASRVRVFQLEIPE